VASSWSSSASWPVSSSFSSCPVWTPEPGLKSWNDSATASNSWLVSVPSDATAAQATSATSTRRSEYSTREAPPSLRSIACRPQPLFFMKGGIGIRGISAYGPGDPAVPDQLDDVGVARNARTTKNPATATAATVALAAVSACHETTRPTTTATTPNTAETSIMAGTRRTKSEAAAGGATRKANTNRLPTVWNEATTARVTSVSIRT